MPWFTFQLNDFARSFISVLFEGVPFLLLGSLISGLVDVFVSSERMQRVLPKNGAVAIAISGFLGLIFPMCECGSVIVIRRFIKKGLPLSAAVTYMLAAPIVSPLVAVSTYAAFARDDWHVIAWRMTSLRLVIGYLLAITIGFIVHRMNPASILQPGALAAPNASRRAGLTFSAMPEPQQDFSTLVAGSTMAKKFLLAVQSATADFLDVAFYFIIGTAAASVFNTGLNQEILNSLALNAPVAILALMGFAVVLAVCSTTDAFIAAASFSKFPFAAKLGFLLLGPVFDLKLFFLYTLLFKRRFVVLLGLGLFIVIWLISWKVSFLDLETVKAALPH